LRCHHKHIPHILQLHGMLVVIHYGSRSQAAFAHILCRTEAPMLRIALAFILAPGRPS